MKRLALIASVGIASTALLPAQSPEEPNEGTQVHFDSANAAWRVKWWGKQGRTYFIQLSPDLQRPWEWLPEVLAGNDAIKQVVVGTNISRVFVRLRHSDIPTADPEAADFDGDGFNNLAEVTAGADPFDPDSDNDGLPDGWEAAHGLNVLDPADAGSDPDDDGLTSLQEYNAGTDPRKFSSGNNGVADGWWLQHGLNPYSNASVDSDSDGRSDLDEFLLGTDPNVFDNAPERPPVLPAPYNLVSVRNEDGSYDLSWQDDVPASQRKRVLVRRQNGMGGWEVVAVVGPNIRSHRLPATP